MYFDIAMPLTLFAVTVIAVFLHGKTEKKLKTTLEEREFRIRDVVMLVAAISITVSVMVFVPQMAVMALFLFAYSMLLFIFTYVFSDFKKSHAQLFCTVFLIISFAAATISILTASSLNDALMYGAIAFCCMLGFSFVALLYENERTRMHERWYLAVLPPALFIILYAFYSQTPIWFPYLLSLYGVVFAILIILYLGSLFTWKTTLIFVALLTVVDIILVLVTKSMVSAATHVAGLRLPVLVVVPTVPQITKIWGMSLGLGDFFFAGLIAIQSLKKFGKRFALLSIVAMTASFFVFETLMLNAELSAFPGTLMIICGWMPLIFLKYIHSRRKSVVPKE